MEESMDSAGSEPWLLKETSIRRSNGAYWIEFIFVPIPLGSHSIKTESQTCRFRSWARFFFFACLAFRFALRAYGWMDSGRKKPLNWSHRKKNSIAFFYRWHVSAFSYRLAQWDWLIHCCCIVCPCLTSLHQLFKFSIVVNTTCAFFSILYFIQNNVTCVSCTRSLSSLFNNHKLV